MDQAGCDLDAVPIDPDVVVDSDHRNETVATVWKGNVLA
jgi:hypothetical protein